MNHSLRVLPALLASLSLVLGCSSGSGGAGGGQGGGDPGGPGGEAMSWPGTWNVALTYHVSCDFSFGNVKEADITQTNGVKLADDGSGGILASVLGYQLTGSGSGGSLTLSGQYPVEDNGKSVAGNVNADNNVTLSIDTVTDDAHASGTITGQFVGEFGQDCTISAGKVTLSR